MLNQDLAFYQVFALLIIGAVVLNFVLIRLNRPTSLSIFKLANHKDLGEYFSQSREEGTVFNIKTSDWALLSYNAAVDARKAILELSEVEPFLVGDNKRNGSIYFVMKNKFDADFWKQSIMNDIKYAIEARK